MSIKIIVAIPTFNEETCIADLVTRAQLYADEVLVVDDGSTDDTALLASAAGASVISHQANFGYGVAIRRILSEAKERCCDILVLLDADSCHNPDDIPSVVEPILDGFDVVLGTRDRKDIPMRRCLVGRIISILTYLLLSGGRVVDCQSGFKAFSSRALEVIRPKEEGVAVSSEMVIMAFRNHLKIAEVPVSSWYATGISAREAWEQGLYALGRLLVMVFKRKDKRRDKRKDKPRVDPMVLRKRIRLSSSQQR